MTAREPKRVLFVCTGNICRSPAAEIIARAADDANGQRFSFASAGTAAWHVGEPIDPRAALALAGRGFDASAHRAQHATDELLDRSDLVVALDRKHREIIRGRLGPNGTTPVVLLRSFDPDAGGAVDIADPYYGDLDAFTECVSMVERAVAGLLGDLNSGSG